MSQAAILVVDDEPASVNLLRITLGMEYTVYTATDGAAGLNLLAQRPEIALAIVDQRMPGMSGTEFIQQTIEPYPNLIRIILTGYTDIESLIDAINAGRVYRYLTKPWNKDELIATVRQGLDVRRLAMENIRLQEELRAANARLRVENARLKREAQGRYRFDEIIGSSPALKRMLQLVERVVATDTTVLITGETGTGKELVARAIHYNGPRADRAFVTENCAAISPELLTSELFGHKRGAFTGATEDRQGLSRWLMEGRSSSTR
jgi:two-component system response regulator HupR/HoxA